jgi:hypothetical protein
VNKRAKNAEGSIFQSPDTIEGMRFVLSVGFLAYLLGKVGVVGSGKKMTEFKQQKYEPKKLTSMLFPSIFRVLIFRFVACWSNAEETRERKGEERHFGRPVLVKTSSIFSRSTLALMYLTACAVSCQIGALSNYGQSRMLVQLLLYWIRSIALGIPYPEQF